MLGTSADLRGDMWTTTTVQFLLCISKDIKDYNISCTIFARLRASSLPNLVHTESRTECLVIEAVIVVSIVYSVESVDVVISLAFLKDPLSEKGEK